MEAIEIRKDLPVIRVMQGRPESPYFSIILPMGPEPVFTRGQEVHCIHPKTNKLVKGIVTGHFWVCEWGLEPTGFLLGEFGVDPKLLRMALIGRDPAFEKEWFRVIQLLEII